MQKSALLIGCGVLIVVALLVVLIVGGGVWSARSELITRDQGVKSGWADVESNYQRRMDLIPNLVQIVKRYAEHESDVFTKVAEARSNAGKIQITAETLNDPNLMARFQQAQGELSSALTRLLAVSENYPQLKANENFRDLQVQLEGTENRINVARERFNEKVRDYNTYRSQKLFALIAGSFFGFDKEKAYFKADAGAQQAPDVGKIFHP